MPACVAALRIPKGVQGKEHKSQSERLSKASPNEIFLEQFVAQTSRGQAKRVDVYETRRSKIAVTAERKTR